MAAAEELSHRLEVESLRVWMILREPSATQAESVRGQLGVGRSTPGEARRGEVRELACS